MSDWVQPTGHEMARAREARAAAHVATCHRGHLDPPGCRMCPTAKGLIDALRVLDENPRDAKGARRALHDVVCMSGCGPDSDHADRTQAKVAAALRKFHATKRHVTGVHLCATHQIPFEDEPNCWCGVLHPPTLRECAEPCPLWKD